VSATLADELAFLVLSGKKRATASLAVEFTSLNESLPAEGDLSIILNSAGIPVAIIERTEVSTVAFGEVAASFAVVEGEGDGSLAYWRSAHTRYFTDVCSSLGVVFNEKTPVICQVFRLAWPVAEAANAHGTGDVRV
jgi:uncharacterized protein YhfF